LTDDYNRSIAQGILIAKKQAPPDLIKLPVTAPEEIILEENTVEGNTREEIK